MSKAGSNRSTPSFQDRLKNSAVESDVENAYRSEFKNSLPNALITSPHRTDGVLETDTLYVLLEFKYDYDFTKKSEVAKPLVQCLVYLRSFYDKEDKFPTAIFVGDKNECFMLSTDALINYVERDSIDWTVPASSAWKLLPSLYREVIQDSDLNPYVLDTQERGFYFQNVVERLEGLSEGDIHKVPVTIHNISGIFRSWEERVLREDVDAQVAVGAFIKSVMGSAYLHPKKKNTLITAPDREVGVHGDQHVAFFDWFKDEYRVSEKRNFTAIKDRLVEEESRRRSGDFYTPAVWAHEAHKMLDAELGPDWREEWVTWDCACGTSNLTRDYAFSELYLSTLFQDDVDTIESMGYNPGSTKFQFDFLNDPLPGQEDLVSQFQGQRSKIPVGLQKALESGKKMVFLINPPFGRAGASVGKGDNKKGVSSTGINDQMDLGACSAQLYAQFMFRISELVEKYDLEDAVFALYSMPLFMSGSSFEKFREYFYSKWEFRNGFLFRADEFNGTSSSWGCSHTLWRRGKEDSIDFNLILKKRDENGVVQDEGTHNFYYPENKASDWAKAPRAMWWGKGDKNVPQLSSAVEARSSGRGSIVKGQLGRLESKGNSVMYNQQEVYWMTWASSRNLGIYVFPQNFRRCLALFSARKTIKRNWINSNDEYCEPNEDHPEYYQWVNDCHVYSLFNSKSQQSSLRDIDYKNKKWNIENEFFWMSSVEMKDLADQYGFDEMYQDVTTFGSSSDRYMYEQLEGMKLSEDARELLDKARSLVRDSMEMRVTAFYEKPEQHLQAWDAGWYQIRNGILKDYYPERYEAFGNKYRELEDRLREGVYKFGFLRS